MGMIGGGYGGPQPMNYYSGGMMKPQSYQPQAPAATGSWSNLNLNPSQMTWANQQAQAMGLGSGQQFVNNWNASANPFSGASPQQLLLADQLSSLGGVANRNAQWQPWINYAGGSGAPNPDSTAPTFTPPAGKSWDPATGGWV